VNSISISSAEFANAVVEYSDHPSATEGTIVKGSTLESPYPEFHNSAKGTRHQKVSASKVEIAISSVVTNMERCTFPAVRVLAVPQVTLALRAEYPALCATAVTVEAPGVPEVFTMLILWLTAVTVVVPVGKVKMRYTLIYCVVFDVVEKISIICFVAAWATDAAYALQVFAMFSFSYEAESVNSNSQSINKFVVVVL
jgi:hypothetical protein